MKLILLLCLIIPNHSFAQVKCEKQVSYLATSTPAPCSGYLFSPEKELEVRLKVQQYNLLKEYSTTQSEINTILEKRLKETQDYNKYLDKRLREEKDNSFWQTALYFSLGVLVTGVIASNVGK